jgi:hypothetical protein
MAEEIFELYPTAKWEVPGKPAITFPVVALRENFANRIVPHKRVYRDGARLDDTGSEATEWSITADFYNSADHEQDVDGPNLYPTVLNKLCDSFTVHETGTLTVPTRGPRRCRAQRYARTEDAENRDFARVEFSWLEDNEDDASQAAFAAPNASAIVKKLGADMVKAAQLDGASSLNMAQINEFVASLEALANAPGEFVADLESVGDLVVGAIIRLERAFANTTDPEQNETARLLAEPPASRALELMYELADASKRIAGERVKSNGPKLITRTFNRDLSLFDIATEVGQSASDLMALNPSLDAFHVPAGTSVVMHESS